MSAHATFTADASRFFNQIRAMRTALNQLQQQATAITIGSPTATTNLRNQANAVNNLGNQLRTINAAVRAFTSANNNLANSAQHAAQQLNAQAQAVRSLHQSLANLPARTSTNVNAIGSSARGAARDVSTLGKTLDRFRATLLAFATGYLVIQGLFGAFRALKDTVFGFNDLLERTRISFTVMFNGARAQADGLIKDLQEFARITPFEFPELLPLTKQMLAMGVATRETVIPALKGIGGAAAGLNLGAEGMGRIILALGQMGTRARASAEEFSRQLTQVGINGLKYLAEAYGTTQGEIMDLMKKGQIGGRDAQRAVLAGLQRDWSKHLQAQENTLSVAWSNIKDTIRMLTADAFTPLFVAVRNALNEVAKITGTNAFRQWAQETSARVVVAFRLIGTTFIWVAQQFNDKFPYIATGLGILFGEAMIAKILAMLAAFRSWAVGVALGFTTVASTMQITMAAVFAFIAAYRQFEVVRDVTDEVVVGVLLAFKTMTHGIAWSIGQITAPIQNFIDFVKSIPDVPGMPEWVKKWQDSITNFAQTFDMRGLEKDTDKFFDEQINNVLVGKTKYREFLTQSFTQDLGIDEMLKSARTEIAAAMKGVDSDVQIPKLKLLPGKGDTKPQKDALSDLATAWDRYGQAVLKVADKIIGKLKEINDQITSVVQDMENQLISIGAPLDPFYHWGERLPALTDAMGKIFDKSRATAREASLIANGFRAAKEALEKKDALVPGQAGEIVGSGRSAATRSAGSRFTEFAIMQMARSVDTSNVAQACAAFAGALLNKMGISVQRTAVAKGLKENALAMGAKQIPLSQLNAGDLVVFRGRQYGAIKWNEGGERGIGYHVGVGIGPGRYASRNNYHRGPISEADAPYASVYRFPGGASSVNAMSGAANQNLPAYAQRIKEEVDRSSQQVAGALFNCQRIVVWALDQTGQNINKADATFIDKYVASSGGVIPNAQGHYRPGTILKLSPPQGSRSTHIGIAGEIVGGHQKFLESTYGPSGRQDRPSDYRIRYNRTVEDISGRIIKAVAPPGGYGSATSASGRLLSTLKNMSASGVAAGMPGLSLPKFPNVNMVSGRANAVPVQIVGKTPPSMVGEAEAESRPLLQRFLQFTASLARGIPRDEPWNRNQVATERLIRGTPFQRLPQVAASAARAFGVTMPTPQFSASLLRAMALFTDYQVASKGAEKANIDFHKSVEAGIRVNQTASKYIKEYGYNSLLLAREQAVASRVEELNNSDSIRGLRARGRALEAEYRIAENVRDLRRQLNDQLKTDANQKSAERFRDLSNALEAVNDETIAQVAARKMLQREDYNFIERNTKIKEVLGEVALEMAKLNREQEIRMRSLHREQESSLAENQLLTGGEDPAAVTRFMQFRNEFQDKFNEILDKTGNMTVALGHALKQAGTAAFTRSIQESSAALREFNNVMQGFRNQMNASRDETGIAGIMQGILGTEEGKNFSLGQTLQTWVGAVIARTTDLSEAAKRQARDQVLAVTATTNALREEVLTRHQLSDVRRQELEWEAEDIARRARGEALTQEAIENINKQRDAIRGLLQQQQELRYIREAQKADRQIEALGMPQFKEEGFTRPLRAVRDEWIMLMDLMDQGFTEQQAKSLVDKDRIIREMKRIEDQFNQFRDSVHSIFEQAFDFNNLYEKGVRGFFESIASGFGDLINDISRKILASYLTRWFFSMFPNLGGFIGAVGNAGDAWQGIGLQSGMDRVPYNGMHAVLHRNEAVLSATEATYWRGMKTGAIGGPATASAYNGSYFPSGQREGMSISGPVTIVLPSVREPDDFGPALQERLSRRSMAQQLNDTRSYGRR